MLSLTKDTFSTWLGFTSLTDLMLTLISGSLTHNRLRVFFFNDRERDQVLIYQGLYFGVVCRIRKDEPPIDNLRDPVHRRALI